MNQDGHNDSLKENLLSESLWLRVIYMVLFYFAGHVVIALVLLIAIVQGVLTLITGQPNLNLQEFSLGLNRYLQQVANFLTFNSENKPFPFSDWPAAGHAEVTDSKDI
ncbi:DUF4389 domain-containing protein [Sansalvadorimonas verongulae]|uniref:DUF4389 domain-containing protein n=1 Tax=Sansalvadorimonas verongulae TaxID=2172824 RepID=UPI0012BCF463|nr:DUF4389 domain-containing protein [Sansalvadorimonas verongulae]MTI13108.1 DUF4389 domain-containing protein [Sansalvadorimonas verongulae]